MMESVEADLEPWSLKVAELESVELGGFEGTLTLTTANTTREIMGIDLNKVKDALMILIDGESLNPEDESNVLLRGPIDIYTSGVLVASGEVVLSNEVFEFRQGRGLEELIWGDLNKKIQLENIVKCEIVGVRRRLEVSTADETLHFRGPVVNHLHSLMVTLGVGTGVALDSQLLHSWEASLFTGPISQKGEIGITEVGFRFNPTGAIESLIGVNKSVSVPLSHIKRASIVGVIDKRLVIVTRDARVLNFRITRPVERLKDLSNLLVGARAEDEPIIPDRGIYGTTDEVTSFIASWGSRSQGLDNEELLLMGAGVLCLGDKSVRRGWLTLTDSRIAFLPASDELKTDEPLFAQLNQVSIGEEAGPKGGQLSLKIGKRKFLFRPAGQSQFIQEFGRCFRGAIKRDRSVESSPDSAPTGTGLVNRRETYRAELLVGLPIKVSVGGSGSGGGRRTVGSKLRDVSLGGCSIITNESLPPRVELAVELDIDGQRVVVNGRLIYSVRLGRNKVRWRHGVVFIDMGFGDAQCIRDLVMGLQREELAQSQVEREIHEARLAERAKANGEDED